MKKRILAVLCLTVALTVTGCGQSASGSASEKEIAELKAEIEELKEENNELKAKIYDYENNKPAQATESSELDGFVAETSGVCGADLTWEYGNGILRISGTGAMSDFYYKEIPWYELGDKIIHVYIDEGCTKIADDAFYGCKNLSKIVIPTSVKEMFISSFETNQEILITIPDNISVFSWTEDGAVVAPVDGTEPSEEYIYEECKKSFINSMERKSNITWIWKGKEYTGDNAETLIKDLEETGVQWH